MQAESAPPIPFQGPFHPRSKLRGRHGGAINRLQMSLTWRFPDNSILPMVIIFLGRCILRLMNVVVGSLSILFMAMAVPAFAQETPSPSLAPSPLVSSTPSPSPVFPSEEELNQKIATELLPYDGMKYRWERLTFGLRRVFTINAQKKAKLYEEHLDRLDAKLAACAEVGDADCMQRIEARKTKLEERAEKYMAKRKELRDKHLEQFKEWREKRQERVEMLEEKAMERQQQKEELIETRKQEIKEKREELKEKREGLQEGNQDLVQERRDALKQLKEQRQEQRTQLKDARQETKEVLRENAPVKRSPAPQGRPEKTKEKVRE